MEKLIEDLISRIETEKAESYQYIQSSGLGDKSIEYIHTGKIFAFDFCSNELKRLLDYKNSSNSMPE